MRNMDSRIITLLSKGEKFIYCFDISKGDGRILLTSCDKEIKIGNLSYAPFSGLRISEMIFNESGQDVIEVTGVFEDEGVGEADDFTDATFVIDLYFEKENLGYRLAEYICTRMKRYGLRFKLYLSSISLKLGRSVLESYSASCRANFCDNRCGIDERSYPNGTSCDKKFITCCNKFNNAINFRGEPFIPEGKNW